MPKATPTIRSSRPRTSRGTDLARTLRSGAAILAVLGSVAGAVAGPLSAQDGGPVDFRAPFRTIERSPVYRIAHTPAAEPGDVVAAGALEVSVASTWSNILEWMLQPGLRAVIDTERWTNQVDLRFGVADGWEVGARLATRTDGGGVLDPLVQWWHARIGLPNGDREKVEDNAFEMFVEREGVVVFTRPSGTRVADPVILVGRRLIGADPDRALTARVTAKLPLGASAAGTGNTDVGVQLDGRRSGERWTLFGGLGWTTMTPTDALEPYARDGAWFGHAAVERDLGPLSAQVQLQAMSAWLHGLGSTELDRAPLNLAVGATWDLVGLRWEAAFVEDIRPESPSVDFTLDLRVRRTLGR